MSKSEYRHLNFQVYWARIFIWLWCIAKMCRKMFECWQSQDFRVRVNLEYCERGNVSNYEKYCTFNVENREIMKSRQTHSAGNEWKYWQSLEKFKRSHKLVDKWIRNWKTPWKRAGNWFSRLIVSEKILGRLANWMLRKCVLLLNVNSYLLFRKERVTHLQSNNKTIFEAADL